MAKKVLRCKDLRTDCPFEATGGTEEEVLKKVREYIEKEHRKKTIPDGDEEVWRKRIENF